MAQITKLFNTSNMSRRTAEILLAAVIIARSTSFLFGKLGIAEMSVHNLMALRYLTAFVILLIPFHGKLKGLKVGTVLRAALLSAIFFTLLTCELTGLKYTDSSVVCFLENSAIVFVPLVSAVLKRHFPKPVVLLSSAVALVGVFFLTARSGLGSFGAGEIFALLAAVLYTAYIIVTDRLVAEKEAFQIGILQNGFLGLYGLVFALATGTARLPQSGMEIFCILMLAVVCSAFGLTLQPVAQSHTTAERAGLFCAVSPVSAATLGALVMKESLGVSGLIGSALILSSIFIPIAAPALMKEMKTAGVTAKLTEEIAAFKKAGLVLRRRPV